MLPETLTPERWVRQMFSARAAADGGIIRRKVADVERLIGRRRFLYEVERRGFHAMENAGQFIVICNQEPIKLLV